MNVECCIAVVSHIMYVDTAAVYRLSDFAYPLDGIHHTCEVVWLRNLEKTSLDILLFFGRHRAFDVTSTLDCSQLGG